MKKNNLVLVTGGAGFIGSHLVDALIESGYQVRVLDNLAPPTHNGKLPPWFNKKAEFIKGDVRKKNDWLKALRGVNYVFHLAAYMDYHLDFNVYFDTNTRGVALLYELIVQKKLPVKKIVIASSQSVYGEGKYYCRKHGIFYPEARSEKDLKKHQWEVVCPKDKGPAKILAETEDDQSTPQIPYGISKLAEEKIALILGKIYRIPTIVLRYSIVQGSRQSFRHFYSGALRDFAVSVLNRGQIFFQEDGRQIRDFVNVHDVVSAHLRLLNDSRADYQILNVGSGQPVKIIDLAKKVCRIAGVEFRPVVKNVFRINAPRHSVMDISKLKSLGWQPQYSLDDSIKEYLDWIKNYNNVEESWKKSYQNMYRSGILRN